MNANSLMRISAKDGMQPIDKFVRNKKNIQYWYDELDEYGVKDTDEIEALESILLCNYGVANTQEDIMELSMHPKISNFTLIEANKMRKIVAKKKDEEVEHLKEMFYEKGLATGNSENVLNYVWEQCIKPQLAYSFSRNHVNPYSAEALQEMNLYHTFPHCYWNCAALAVNASSVDISNDYDDIDYDVEETVKTKGTDYGKVAKAIYRSKNFGVPVLPPDINKSQLTFTPIEEDDTIRFGLAGISGINQEIAKEIIEGRPYESFKHFYDYHKSLQVETGELDEDGAMLYRNSLVTKSKIISLIKSGCFDCFNPNRVALMKWLCVYETGKKEKLTTSNLSKCIELGVELPANLVKAYRFKQYVLSKDFFYRNNVNFKSKKDYYVEPKFARPYLEEHYMSNLIEDRDYYFVNGDMFIIDKALEKAMSKDLDKLKEYLSDSKVVEDFNKKNLQVEYRNMVETDDVNKWSFDSVCFYDKEHELAHVDLTAYNVVKFGDLPEEPLFEESVGRNGKVWKRYILSRICGTVLSRNDNSHLVDILTPDDEVVTLNIPQGQFGFYKKVISENVDGKKTVIEDSWLKRGNKIFVVGYRRGDAFFVKRYVKSIYQHSIVLINKINEDGSLELTLERYNDSSEE